MFLGYDIRSWLGLSIVGTVVTTLGSVFGIILKDRFFTRSFELWKQQQNLDQIYQRFRDPLVLAARELASRTLEILDEYPTVYLRKKVLSLHPERQVENSTEDAHFQRYKLISTAYRLSAFFGWLELYRQEITFLHPGDNRQARSLEEAVGKIRSDFADGQLNVANNWHEWRDTLVFREELRAIGESLIESRDKSRTVVGYGRYCEQLESESSNSVKRWSPTVLNFYLDLETSGKDFRLIRLQRMYVHLIELMRLLDEDSVDEYLQKLYDELTAKSGGN